ncbi:MAG: FISUMP domain-containing protein [Bacteroidales bacterium]|nr:FISUMP domain-containing protein [Bacteroidales bacterium]
MKRITILFFIILASAKINAQDYQIIFAGKGASTIVDSVKAENLTQCTDTILGGNDILHLTGSVGITETKSNEGNNFRVYPNPVTDYCTIEFEVVSAGNTAIEICDISGKIIFKKKILLPKGIHEFRISGINRGIYFLKIISDTYLYSAKIVSINANSGTARLIHKETTAINENKNYISNKEKTNKSRRAITDMQYTTGNLLKLTGYSGGIYSTILMQVPTQSQTDTFDFVECTDADNNHYSVVQIGTQLWMGENLETTKYINGDSIHNITGGTQWSNDTTGAYCDYNNNAGNSTIYGKLYNFFAVADTCSLCPSGWHVPTDIEWNILVSFLQMLGETGKLKANCTTLWQSPNQGATNETGFTALPGGYRDYTGLFKYIGQCGYWWSSTAYADDSAWYRFMYYDYSNASRFSTERTFGFSVRCMKNK